MSRLFDELREGAEYFNMSLSYELGMQIMKEAEEHQYYLHYVKQKNSQHKDDETLCELYKKKNKLQKEITKREQELNHGK